MKKIVVASVGLITVIVAVFLWARSLPAIHEVTVKKTINAPVDKVWRIMTSWGEQTAWRKGIDSIEIIDGNRFVEHPERGAPIHFFIAGKKSPGYLKLNMSGPFQGTYTAKLESAGSVTIVTAQEKIIQESLVGRLFMTVFFDLDDFARSYLNQLATYAENS